MTLKESISQDMVCAYTQNIPLRCNTFVQPYQFKLIHPLVKTFTHSITKVLNIKAIFRNILTKFHLFCAGHGFGFSFQSVLGKLIGSTRYWARERKQKCMLGKKATSQLQLNLTLTAEHSTKKTETFLKQERQNRKVTQSCQLNLRQCAVYVKESFEISLLHDSVSQYHHLTALTYRALLQDSLRVQNMSEHSTSHQI